MKSQSNFYGHTFQRVYFETSTHLDHVYMGKYRLSFKFIHPAAQSTLGKQQWDSLVSEHSVGFQIKIGRPKFYAGEMITPA